MLTLDKVRSGDIEKLKEIHGKFYDFPFPNLNDPLYALQHIVRDDDGQIIMAVMVKLTTEGIFITNKDISPFKRVAAIKIVFDAIDVGLKMLGLEDIHVFSENNNHYIEFLKKLGFMDCTGVPLVSFVRSQNGQKSTEEHI